MTLAKVLVKIVFLELSLIWKINELLNNSLMLITALNTRIGYYKSAEIANFAFKKNISLKEAAKKLNYVSEEDFDKWVKPEDMTGNDKISFKKFSKLILKNLSP